MIFLLSFQVNIDGEYISDITDTSVREKEEICDITASFVGTWQRRSYASLNSVITAISIENGKCLAYEFQTKNFKSLEKWAVEKRDRGAR